MVEYHETWHTCDGEMFISRSDAHDHEARIKLKAWFKTQDVDEDHAWAMAELLVANADTIVEHLRYVLCEYRLQRKDERY